MGTQPIIPLIIDGRDILAAENERHGAIVNKPSHGPLFYQGATRDLAIQATESSARAYTVWSRTTPVQRRSLLLKLAEVRRQSTTNDLRPLNSQVMADLEK